MIGNDQLQNARLNKVFISLMFLSSLLGCSGEESVIAEKTIVETFSEDPQALGRGRALFQGSCAGQCHGMDGVEIVEVEDYDHDERRRAVETQDFLLLLEEECSFSQHATVAIVNYRPWQPVKNYRVLRYHEG